MKMRNNLFLILMSACMLFFLWACGGSDGDSTTPSTDTGTTLSGVASKGMIADGTVNVYAITNDGQKGDLLGTTTTDSDGNYTLKIDYDYDGPVLVEVSGGTYVDEATGQTVDLDGTLRAALPSVSDDVSVAVTPLTEIAVRVAETSGSMDATKIADANDLVSQMLGEDIISTLPVDCSDATKFADADAGAQNYTLLLAAISQMAETSDQNISDILEAIEEDLSDMALDETSENLLTAVDDFLSSDENETGVEDASNLTDTIEDVVENGFDPIYRVDAVYLQYRTVENSSSGAYRGYFGLSKSNVPVEMADIDNVTVKDADGNEISASNTGFWPGMYYYYNCRTTPKATTGPIKESGVYGTLDTLDAGTYEIEILMTDGQIVTKQIAYPGKLALPVVESSTMQSQWSDGDLILSWTNPTGAANWSYVDQIRIVLFDGDGNDRLFVSLDVTEESVTLPAALIDKAISLGSAGMVSWQVQTRAYDDNGMNYARGNSSGEELDYAIDYSFMQYRNFEDTASNHYRIWMGVQADGQPVNKADFSNFKVYDDAGDEITPLAAPFLWISAYPYLVYNCQNSPCTLSNPLKDCGYIAKFDDLPAGDYQFTVDSPEGTLTTHVDYLGKLELPVIASSSFQAQEMTNGDWKLSWTNPTGEANWSEVDQLRFVLANNDGYEVLVVKVSPDVETVTIPDSVIEEASLLGAGEITEVNLQTRAYDETNMNHARGISWLNLD